MKAGNVVQYNGGDVVAALNAIKTNKAVAAFIEKVSNEG